MAAREIHSNGHAIAVTFEYITTAVTFNLQHWYICFLLSVRERRYAFKFGTGQDILLLCSVQSSPAGTGGFSRG